MRLGSIRVPVASVVVALAVCVVSFLFTGTSGAVADAAAQPNLAKGSAYLVAPANLKAGHYYESFPGTADFGLTIDGALALAATGDEDTALRAIVNFLAADGKDPSGQTVSDWTGIGTANASGGAIGKEALLAEVTGRNPRSFGGLNLIAALGASVCQRKSGPSCPAAGAYRYAASVFDQAFGILAQLRAGQARAAAAPVAYLESLQAANGSFPSLIPPSGAPDVDSTAMAVMALALAPGTRAAADVKAGVAWIAGEQERNGGFPGTGAESVNSTGLAIQALTLRAASYRLELKSALAFLAGQQDSDGGFNADAGQSGANLRASTQAVGGAVGTSFGTLSVDLSGDSNGQPPATSRPNSSGVSTALPQQDCTATAGAIVAVDFAHWGGPVLRSCGSTPTTGYAELNQGGWRTTGDEHDGPGFICRIGYSGYLHATEYPTSAQQACVQTPPVNAYWAAWQAGPGQTTWSYSQYGAMDYHPEPGSVTLWVFGGTNLSGTAGSARPPVTPQALRDAAAGSAVNGLKIVNAPPVTATASAAESHGSPWPAILAVAIVAVLAAAGAVGVARRRRLERS